ncbi:glycosyltransferase [Microbacterium murale]|uniref:Dolichol-phosphate mannosyltransferase n=1 Tax=Microbacterium murale TaxID=1081040 RepID=A0ABU0P9S5_9MICO|nr:glycosyltransferase family 2 protein [Microbacterium murale]MDQ0644084.1 dolichol-phosphate mannosyltransferase [Microbacterium murale]
MGTAVTIIVPTFNERDNVAELISRVAAAVDGHDAEILFVDDSTDATAAEITRVAVDAPLPVRVIHRAQNTGGLSGAVALGLAEAAGDTCIVMDGDLQHPPELIPQLLSRFEQGDVDIVAASRYVGGGDSRGLGTAVRFGISRAATWLTKAMFPRRLARSTDPMTGFFLVDRRSLDVPGLRPQGFKILLEILARSDVRIAEVPMEFSERRNGTSKATMRQGATFVAHLARLRFGKMSLFAVIGGIGAVVNLAIMWALTTMGMPYIWAAIVGAEVTIVGNFFLQERFVFGDMRFDARGVGSRFAASFTFNNVEAALRIPVMALMVETWHISSVLATGLSLIVAFFARFLFHSLFVYAPRRGRSRVAGAASEPRPRTAPQRIISAIDAEAMRPGEL